MTDRPRAARRTGPLVNATDAIRRDAPRRCLVLLTESYPFGPGESYVENEIFYLDAAFDELIVISNDVEGDAQRRLPDGVTCIRAPYGLSFSDQLKGAGALLDSEPREELRRIRATYSLDATEAVRNTVYASWFKAKKYSRTLRRIAADRPGTKIYAYSYWANDMAIAVALANARGWVDVGICRAHGWDVYFERSNARFLPFRRFLAENLDFYRFVSKDGLEYFRAMEGDYASLGCSRLGTPLLAENPLAAHEPFVIVSCSTMIPLKRVERIAQALEGVEHRVRWIHIGDGPARPVVEEVVSRLPAEIEVELTGELPNAQVHELYRTTRPTVFVNLSAFEGVPVAMMEAMAAGIPVVATAVGGVPEIVADGKNGVLLEPDPAPAAVRAAIEMFLQMSEVDYRAYSETAWETWRRCFNADVNYPAFIGELIEN